MSASDPSITRSFFESLQPLLLRLNAERTISLGKIGVLRHVAEHRRATTAELASAIRVSPQGISLAVRELDRLGFVTRVPDADDRRRVWIELTGAGRQKLAQESSAGLGWLSQSVQERLTPDEREILKAAIPILKKMGAETRVD
jgi:DNA-binding MarR family transcriptional regulator